MSTIFNMGEMIPVPESVGVCPDCDGPLKIDFHEWTPFLEEADLYAPGEVFAMVCEDGCHIGIFADAPDPDDDIWKERYKTWEEKNQAWKEVYEKISEWLSHTPFLIEGSILILDAGQLRTFLEEHRMALLGQGIVV